jgi:hypothetical protein
MEFCWKQFDILAKRFYRGAAGSNAGMLGRADVPEIVTNGKVLR